MTTPPDTDPRVIHFHMRLGIMVPQPVYHGRGVPTGTIMEVLEADPCITLGYGLEQWGPTKGPNAPPAGQQPEKRPDRFMPRTRTPPGHLPWFGVAGDIRNGSSPIHELWGPLYEPGYHPMPWQLNCVIRVSREDDMDTTQRVFEAATRIRERVGELTGLHHCRKLRVLFLAPWAFDPRFSWLDSFWTDLTDETPALGGLEVERQFTGT